MDAATGLFTRDLFASHLVRLAQAACGAQPHPFGLRAARSPRPAAVSAARAGGWLDRAMPQIGSMIGRLVRVEDTAARLGAEVFALAMPDTTLAAAMAAGERIAAVIACTAFDAGDSRPPFVAEFDIGAAEVEAGAERRPRAGDRRRPGSPARSGLRRTTRSLPCPAPTSHRKAMAFPSPWPWPWGSSCFATAVQGRSG